MLGARVRLVVDTVTRIDADNRSMVSAGGDTVGYDYLVYAVGSGSADARVRPNSPIRSPLWRRRSECGKSSTPRPPRPRDGGRRRTLHSFMYRVTQFLPAPQLVDEVDNLLGLAWFGVEFVRCAILGVIHITGRCCQEFGGCLVQGAREPDRSEP